MRPPAINHLPTGRQLLPRTRLPRGTWCRDCSRSPKIKDAHDTSNFAELSDSEDESDDEDEDDELRGGKKGKEPFEGEAHHDRFPAFTVTHDRHDTS